MFGEVTESEKTILEKIKSEMKEFLDWARGRTWPEVLWARNIGKYEEARGLSREGMLIPERYGFLMRVKAEIPTTVKNTTRGHEVGHTFFYEEADSSYMFRYRPIEVIEPIGFFHDPRHLRNEFLVTEFGVRLCQAIGEPYQFSICELVLLEEIENIMEDEKSDFLVRL